MMDVIEVNERPEELSDSDVEWIKITTTAIQYGLETGSSGPAVASVLLSVLLTMLPCFSDGATVWRNIKTMVDAKLPLVMAGDCAGNA